MSRLWRGDVFLERGWLLYDGAIGITRQHAHHAIQIVIASDLPIEIESSTDRAAVESAVIPADQPHAIRSVSPRVAAIYLAPESRAGRRLAARLSSTSRVTDWVAAAAPLRGLAAVRVTSWDDATRLADDIGERLGAGSGRPRPWPPAVERAVAMLPDRLPGQIRLSTLAAEVGLSSSRLSHLVTEYLGLPFRRYVLWLRIQSAADAMARGRNITEAAYVAGFADGPHLTRVFGEMFGIAPSELATSARWQPRGLINPSR